MIRDEIVEAYLFLRKNNQTISDAALNFMYESALAAWDEPHESKSIEKMVVDDLVDIIDTLKARIARASHMMKSGDYSITGDELTDGLLTDVSQTMQVAQGNG